MYDVILTEENIITLITYWRQVELDRALRLAAKEGNNHPWSIAGIIKTGMGRIGQSVTGSLQKFSVPQYIYEKRNKIKVGTFEIEGLVFT